MQVTQTNTQDNWEWKRIGETKQGDISTGKVPLPNWTVTNNLFEFVSNQE